MVVHTAEELNRTPLPRRSRWPRQPAVGGIGDGGADDGPRSGARHCGSVCGVFCVTRSWKCGPSAMARSRSWWAGEVRSPGVYEMISARMGVLEALTLAGGANNRARLRQVVVLRRAENGGVMMRTVNVRDAQQGAPADTIPLARHDIVFAPRTAIAEINDFTELYIRKHPAARQRVRIRVGRSGVQFELKGCRRIEPCRF